jgi:hypothetical protein
MSDIFRWIAPDFEAIALHTLVFPDAIYPRTMIFGLIYTSSGIVLTL